MLEGIETELAAETICVVEKWQLRQRAGLLRSLLSVGDRTRRSVGRPLDVGRSRANSWRSWVSCECAMGEHAADCPDCKGKGTVERTEAEDDRKWLEVFPRLCDRCGGTGKVAKPRSGVDGS